METRPSRHRTRGGLLLALATAACWAAWTGWDRRDDLDPLTGDATGPYQPWQVVGCVLCLAVVAAVAARSLPAGVVVVGMSVVFTAAWSVSAATAEVVGANLWPIGAATVLLGMLVGTTAVVGTVHVLRRRTGPCAGIRARGAR